MKELVLAIAILVVVTTWGVLISFMIGDIQKTLQKVLENQTQIILLLAPEHKNSISSPEVPADKNRKQGMKPKGW
jgi:hypothetical protein